jgi:hypothetical protein
LVRLTRELKEEAVALLAEFCSTPPLESAGRAFLTALPAALSWPRESFPTASPESPVITI